MVGGSPYGQRGIRSARPLRLRIAAALLWLFVAQAVHSQDLLISGAELVSGQAAQELASLGQQASQQRQPLRVVAPERWHAMIGKQLAATADPGAVRFEDSEAQNISIWLGAEDDAGGESAAPLAPDAPRATTPRPSDASQALRDSSRSQVENLKVAIPGADELLGRQRVQKPDLGRAPGASSEQPVPNEGSSGGPALADSPQVSQAPVVEPKSEDSPQAAEPAGSDRAPAAAQAEPAAPVAMADLSQDLGDDGSEPASAEETAALMPESVEKSVAAKQALERRVNSGKPIDETITSADLKRRDRLFVMDGVVAVVRAAGTRNRVYWLSDDLDLSRPELEQESASRYRVRRTLAPPAAEVDALAPGVLNEKARMEARFNGGKKISRELSIAALRPDDVLYIGNGVIVVSRQVQARTRRYWLNGELYLPRRELEQPGTRRYRVVRQLR
ncbi:MAG: hypothetical protein AAF552_16180 [Pseudomonadota bacterium]